MAVIQLIGNSVMNTASHTGSNTAYREQCYEHSIIQMAVIQIIGKSVMNTASHSGSNIDYREQCYEHSITQWQ